MVRTINGNFRTGVHKDGGDFGGWAVLSVLQEGQYEGGIFMMPQYGIGIDIREGDVLVADVHQFHCNSKLFTTPEQDIYNEEHCKLYKNPKQHKWVDGSKYKFTRISFVCYLRGKMNECENIPDKPIKALPCVPKYKIVIPSYNRIEQLRLQTLLFLNNHKFKKEDIFIFIRSDDNKLEDYMLLKEEGYNIIITNNVKGIGRTHNYITNYFEPDEFIVELDDDVMDIIDKEKESILDFKDVINNMKTKMIENKVSYGGLYSCPNTYFMKNSKMDDYTYDLKYCLGLVRMRFIRKDIILETNYSEDMENCIKYYIRDGKILRNNTIVGITKNYAQGGCKADGRDNQTEKKDKEFLADKYPSYCRLFQRKSGIWDLRIRHYKGKK